MIASLVDWNISINCFSTHFMLVFAVFQQLHSSQIPPPPWAWHEYIPNGLQGLTLSIWFTCPSGTWFWKFTCPAKIFMCPANICTSPVKVMYTAGKIGTCPDWKITCPVRHATAKVYVPWPGLGSIPELELELTSIPIPIPELELELELELQNGIDRNWNGIEDSISIPPSILLTFSILSSANGTYWCYKNSRCLF